jgi:phosphoenolpyruvate carboxykinase (ATP)
MQQIENVLALIGGSARIRRGNDRNALVAAAVAAGEGRLSATGALVATTGKHTGRSPKDKFIVRDGLTGPHVWWDNTAAMSPAHFDLLLADMIAHANGKDLWQEVLSAGAHMGFRVGVNVFTETAWHALFIRNLLRPAVDDPQMNALIFQLPSFTADPARHGTRSGTVIALDMSRNIVLIAGTAYAGEIKKSVFSLINFHAPLRGIFPMHCSANIGPAGDTALFFGLSGTGKTTLSSEPSRPLIGDDEHLWSDNGVANIEGGCYAKTAHLSAEAEPEIHAAAHAKGSVLENVILDADGHPVFGDLSLTENTRAAYPLEVLGSVVPSGTGDHPKTIVLLTADAFGVLPPIARLTSEQAVEQFLLGYTAKVAGTEAGVKEPEATFSACFGAPFMSHHPTVYGDLFAKKLQETGAAVWLVNTGWIGGGYGVGKRIDIAATRRLVAAALSGELAEAPTRLDPNFGFAIPVAVDGISPKLLDPRANWSDPAAYDRAAANLVAAFDKAARRIARADAVVAA